MAVSTSLQDKEKLAFQVFQAAIDGSPEEIQSLLSDLPLDMASDILNTYVQCSESMCTPLTMASFRGHSNVVQLLVEDYHVDINKKSRENPLDKEAVTALILAAHQGHLHIVKMLVKAGCHLDARNSSGETAVYIACRLNQPEMVEYLCENGADVNIPNKEGNTCLMTSCVPGREELARILLKNGANPNLGFEREAPCNPLPSTTPLLEGPASKRQGEKCTTALHIAVENHATETVELLLLHGAQVFNDDTNCTPVDIACKKDFFDIVEIFATSHAVSGKEKIICWERLGRQADSWTEKARFLRLATEERQRLLDSISDSCSALPPKNSPKRDVAYQYFYNRFYGSLSDGETISCPCLQDLLKFYMLKVEYIEKVSELSYNKLRYTVEFCLRAILQGLKEAKDEEEERQFEELTRRLIRLSPVLSNAYPAIHVAVNMMMWIGPKHRRFYDLPYERLLPLLLKCGASVHTKDIDGNRPLHVVAGAVTIDDDEYKEILTFQTRTLLEAGALVGVKNNAGETPLMLARNITEAEIIRPHGPPSLKSLAATEVVWNKIPFEDKIPRDLVAFVELH